MSLDDPPSPGHPGYLGLAGRLELIARLIEPGPTISIHHLQIGTIGTHANRAESHAGLLFEMRDSRKASLDDLEDTGEADRLPV